METEKGKEKQKKVGHIREGRVKAGRGRENERPKGHIRKEKMMLEIKERREIMRKEERGYEDAMRNRKMHRDERKRE